MGPTVAYISHPNLRHNISLIRNAVGKRKIMAVVKANAYGHGDIEIAQTVINAGCEYLGVAFIEEGIRLRQAGITAPILVFGVQLPELLPAALENQLDITLTNFEQINFLENLKPLTKVHVHLKIDTGMNRAGFPYDQLEPALKRITDSSVLELTGVYSHFSTSDEKDGSYALLQIERFKKIEQFVRGKSDAKILFHMANSGAIMKYPDSYFDLVRPGIMLYGQPPSPDFELDWALHEVMTLHSRLGLIKLLAKNEPVSYGRRYYTKEATYIGVIPVGYADGFGRGNTNNAEVIIRKKRYPVTGTVCMDMIMVDLGRQTDCEIGDTVVLYGDEIPIREVAARLNTIPYEITCNVSGRVPRIHIYK
jgi:alanine racemase